MSDKNVFKTLMLSGKDSKLFIIVAYAKATFIIHMSLMSVFRLVFNLGARHY
jgi:hypothetical protein